VNVLLDTHIWVWWLTATGGLSVAERRGLDIGASQGELHLSAISLWEAQMLYARSRLELPLSFAEWLRRATDPRMLTIVPLDVGVVLAVDSLPSSFHGDPADRLIVATARAHAMPLATHDSNIRRSRSVKLWKP
jgi:PIN domain nuclease of toxin-antitoxin system